MISFVQTPIFKRKGLSRDMEKQAKPLECCSFLGFPLKLKKLLQIGVWDSIWARFSCQVEPCWAPSWLKMILEHDTKKLAQKQGCGQQQRAARNSLLAPNKSIKSTQGSIQGTHLTHFDPFDQFTSEPDTLKCNLALHCAQQRGGGYIWICN